MLTQADRFRRLREQLQRQLLELRREIDGKHYERQDGRSGNQHAWSSPGHEEGVLVSEDSDDTDRAGPLCIASTWNGIAGASQGGAHLRTQRKRLRGKVREWASSNVSPAGENLSALTDSAHGTSTSATWVHPLHDSISVPADVIGNFIADCNALMPGTRADAEEVELLKLAEHVDALRSRFLTQESTAHTATLSILTLTIPLADPGLPQAAIATASSA